MLIRNKKIKLIIKITNSAFSNKKTQFKQVSLDSEKRNKNNKSSLHFSEDIEQWSIDNFITKFEKNAPIKFNKNHNLKSDQNLECFVPLDRLINKIKAVAISKNFLENFIKILNSENDNEIESLSDFCDENLVNRLAINLNQIMKIKKDKSSHLKYKIKLKSDDNLKDLSLKKIQFNVNLFNIKNYVFLGVDPNRKISKNYRTISHIRDTFLSNPPLNEKEESRSIKADIISHKETFRIYIDKQETIPLCLISQFEFSIIPVKNLILNIQIEDELSESKVSHDLNISSIDFTVECELLRLNYKELSELEKEIKKEEHTNDIEIQSQNEEIQCAETNFKLLDFLNAKEFEKKFKYDLKIIDIDKYLNGNDII